MKVRVEKETVILLHALMLGKRSLHSLERCLQQAGYSTLNVTYPSNRLAIEDLVEYVHSIIGPSISEMKTDVHFVGHSLGGLMARAYVTRYRPKKLGRVVQLGSPNQGSEGADFAKRFWILRKMCGKALEQLGASNLELQNVLGPITYELGALAGSKNILFITGFLFKGLNDGIVSVESTRAPGMKDHIILPVDHMFFPMYKRVHRQVIHFLKEGEFDREMLEAVVEPTWALNSVKN